MGKSTIAHSIAQAYDVKTSPRASFFFSRDQKARREIQFLFQTIAFQLRNEYPALKVEIAKSLEDESLLTSNLRSQLRKLILEPISRISHLVSDLIVIVLDALDECEEEDAVSCIIELLVAELTDSSPLLKFLVTSCPEMHICSAFDSTEVDSDTSPFVLHEVPQSDVEHDIKTFITHGLHEVVKSSHKILNSELWPDEQEIEALVQISGGLFIAAAAALKFIHPVCGSFENMIFNFQDHPVNLGSLHPFQFLDYMYTQILELATSGIQPPYIFQQFKTTVGLILLAYAHLTRQELAGLLQMKEDQVQLILAELQSVIHLSDKDEDSVHAFHLSFHDYLTDTL